MLPRSRQSLQKSLYFEYYSTEDLYSLPSKSVASSTAEFENISSLFDFLLSKFYFVSGGFFVSPELDVTPFLVGLSPTWRASQG